MNPSTKSPVQSPVKGPEPKGEFAFATAAEQGVGDWQRMLQSLTDNTGRPILYLDTGHVLRFVNRPFQEWVGMRAADMLGRHASKVLPQSAYQFYLPHLHLAAAGQSSSVETISLARAGDQRHLRVSFFPDIVEGGRLVGIFVIALDIEEDYQLRQSLIAKELDLRAIADNIGMPISRSDCDLRYRYVNQVACEWFGRPAAEIIGRTWHEVIGADQFAQIEPLVRRALAGEQVSYERLARFAGHESGHIRVNMFPDRDDSGKQVGIYVVIADSEGDYRLRQEIVERERQLRLLTDNVGLPITYVDTDERVTFYNRSSAEWNGIKPGEIIGKSLDQVFAPEVLESVRPFLQRGFAGEHATYERLADVKGKGKRWIRGHVVPDIRDSGKVTGIYVVLTDIHDDVIMRENLQQQERQLRLFTDNIPESIAYIDPGRRYKFVNNTFLRLRGKSRHEVIGRTAEEILGVEAAQISAPHVARAIAGETVSYERKVRAADGSERWFHIRMVPDIGYDGQVQGVYLDSIPHPMVYIDQNYRYQLVNKRVEEMLGVPRESLLNRDLKEVFGEKRYYEVKPFWDRAMAGETITVERQIGTNPATMRWMIVRYTPRFDASGKIIGIYSAATDIDELKRTEIDLRRANWLLSSHFENTPLAVIEWDHDYRLRRWSPQAEKIFGWREAELTGKHFRDWKFVVEGDMEQADTLAAKLTTHGEPRATSLHRNYRKDGRVIWCEWYNSSLRDEDGNILSILSLAQDVTTRVLAEERLVHQATHDSLTGLPNRTLLQDRLRQAISRARRGGYRVATMFIDLDRFKDVNDTLGHSIGDELLREIATRLARVVRDSDLLVRLSGDEFMVVLEQVTDLESPRIVANKLLDEIRQPSRIEGHDIHVSASVGISLFPDDADDVETLLKNADMAMYRAKELGKNAFQVFSSDLAEYGTAMRLLENALRSAVVRGEFELHYQPKVDMRSGHITGAEALLRWHHPTRGMVAPGEFMNLAEETGLIHEIGDWVIGAALAQVQKWHAAGFTQLRVAVNLAAGQFSATNLAERVRESLQREGCPPQAIEVEITETSMLRDPQGVGETLAELREMGLRVAIDDFGTGYSSLSHLKRFPIDTLKIDKTFVADILTDKDDTAIVSAVIAMARALDIEVIAEGVETEAQRDLLARMGCDAYQGYLFSRPLPAAEFEALMLRSSLPVNGK
jgi:diguanylate cyclase (GGDEF)-like protein/PAS domain S-box-containing protein